MNIFLTIDPAYLNFKSAFKGTIAVIISFIIASKLSPLMGFLGGMLALLPSILISDVGRRAQMVTMLLMIPFSAVALVPSILLSSHPTTQKIIFLVVTFMAIYLRKYGSRWITLGMVGFMSYFLPLFFPIKMENIPNVLLTVIMSIGFSFLLRFFFLPERAETTLKYLLKAWNTHYQFLVKSQEKGNHPSYFRINELTLMIENLCKSIELSAIKLRTEALQMALFEREMDLQFENATSHSPILLDELTEAEVKNSSQIKNTEIATATFFPSTTNLAIQASIAVAIASYFGTLISIQRWYWAPMAAFVTLTGTSRGETIVRAIMRVSGTLLGLICGIVIGPFIIGHPNLEWTLIIFSIFMGIFSMKFNFGFWSASVFTFMLTVLFHLMGQFTNEVLILRFEETLLGAGLGAIISTLVLPTSTRKVIKDAISKTLRAQAKVLSLLPLESHDRESKRNLVQTIRNMEQEFSILRALAVPYTGKVTILKHKEITTILHHTTCLNHYVKHLAVNKQVPPFKDQKQGLKRTSDYIMKVADDLEHYIYNQQALLDLGNIKKLMEEPFR